MGEPGQPHGHCEGPGPGTGKDVEQRESNGRLGAVVRGGGDGVVSHAGGDHRSCGEFCAVARDDMVFGVRNQDITKRAGMVPVQR